jgi:hypothetical protein
MTATTISQIPQNAPDDVKEAAFFAFDQPLDPTLEARVEASGLAYMLLRRAERAEQALEVQTERAACYDDYQRAARRAFDAGAIHIYMDLDDGVESLINDRDAAKARAEEVETKLREYADDLDNAKRRAEQAELTASKWEQAATTERRSWAAFQLVARAELPEDAKAALEAMGTALGVAERQRKQAESERDQHARAIVAWHLEAQRSQAETIKLAAELNDLRAHLQSIGERAAKIIND